MAAGVDDPNKTRHFVYLLLTCFRVRYWKLNNKQKIFPFHCFLYQVNLSLVPYWRLLLNDTFFSQTYHAKWFLSVSTLLVGEKCMNFATPFTCNISIMQVPAYYISEDSKSYMAWELYIQKPELYPLTGGACEGARHSLVYTDMHACCR